MEISELTKTDWDTFVEASPQGTVFNKSCFLESYGYPVKYLKCSHEEEQIAGFAAIDVDGNLQLMSYLVCNGVLFNDLSHLKTYHRHEYCYLAMQALAGYLFDHYAKIDFVNHWDITDARAFLSFNFDQREKGHFEVSLSYTSLLDISDSHDISGYASDRRREINKNTKSGKWETRESQDIDLLVRMHEMPFERQGITRSELAVRSIKKICEALLQARAARIFVTYLGQEPVAVKFFALDRYRAYYLIGGGEEQYRDEGVGTLNFHHACIALRETLGIRQVDMVGINNIQRARYKLSYGGSVVPYLRIKKVIPLP